MKKALLIICSAILASFTLNNANADGGKFSGKTGQRIQNGWDDCHVLCAAATYSRAIRETDITEAERSEARANLKKTILEYPDEINDWCIEGGGENWSALSCAIICNDEEMVLFLLEHGAYPFLPSPREMQKLLSDKLEISPGIKTSILKAQENYNILEAVIVHQREENK